MFDGAPAIEASRVRRAGARASSNSADETVRSIRLRLDVGVGRRRVGAATLLLTILDATGASLGAVMVPVETPVGEPEAAGPNLTDVPPDVAATAQRIYDAAKAKDFDALRELLDLNDVHVQLQPRGGPDSEWRGRTRRARPDGRSWRCLRRVARSRERGPSTSGLIS